MRLTIGKNLNSVRKKRRLSLDKVAELTSVSKAMLGQIERGESTPSVNVLWKIATGLKVSFSSLLANGEEDKETLFIHHSDIKPIVEENGQMRIYPQFIFDSNRGFEVFIIELEPDCTHRSPPHDEGVEEYISLIEGTLEIVIGENVYLLNKGDAIRYLANQEHIYRNLSDQLTSFHHLIYYFS
ncbi:Transcriptional regulator [Desulfosporosinus sp. I2]|uniref:helix-turn-helix domain-containing protein n=1 Tax=Desulfosporosinus sp. I2 TaxID=1617025 RepID=UPI0005EF2404|nr:XRE family transcriptional regulator [Desulfosporosinus sp. I2]KJR45159.1 Transcriptional regulator [Desulfosporosinus sp. I2]